MSEGMGRLSRDRVRRGLGRLIQVRSWPLGHQVAGVLALVTLGVAVVTSQVVMELESRWLKSRFQEVVHGTSRVLSSSVLNPVIVQDRPVLQEIVEELLLDQPNIISAEIVNNEGFVLASAVSIGPHAAAPRIEVIEDVQELSLMGEYFGFLRIRWNIDPEMALINQMAYRISLITSGSVVLAGLLLLFVIHRIAIQPVNRISRRMQSLRPGSELAAMPIKAAPEVTRLNDAIDELAAGYKSQKELEMRLQQSEKMEAIGRLAGGVAHNINNALMVVLGHTELLWMRMQSWKGPDISAELEAIQHAGEQSASLTKELLVFGRQASKRVEVISPTALIAKMNDLVSPLIDDGVELEFDEVGSSGLIGIDVVQFESILVNLIVNAQDAMPDGGKIRISSKSVLKQPEHQDMVGSKLYTQIDIQDSGIGMDKQTQAQIFEPFFTTKTQGQGTGLGLASVYGIMQGSGGWVESHSVLGEGTRFSLFFPEVDGTLPEDELPKPLSIDLHGTETVLVVEDESGVLDLTGDVLRQHGYRVLSASNGVEAELIAGDPEQHIDLVLTDAIMPEMNGVLLREIVRRTRPGLPVVLMTGYGGRELEGQLDVDSELRVLRKPFSPFELLKVIREQCG